MVTVSRPPAVGVERAALLTAEDADSGSVVVTTAAEGEVWVETGGVAFTSVGEGLVREAVIRLSFWIAALALGWAGSGWDVPAEMGPVCSPSSLRISGEAAASMRVAGADLFSVPTCCPEMQISAL